MTRSYISVTQGSGTKLGTNNYTDGGDSKHDEVVILGEQHLASYTVSSDSSSTATANSHLVQIMAGASLKVRIRRIEMHQNAMATTAALMETRLYRLTTAGTGDAPITPRPLDPADPASGATAGVLPTAKGTEGVLLGIGKPYLMQTVGASTPLAQPVLVWDFDRPRSKPLIIAAGSTNGIAIKNMTAVAGATIMVMVWFDEAPY